MISMISPSFSFPLVKRDLRFAQGPHNYLYYSLFYVFVILFLCCLAVKVGHGENYGVHGTELFICGVNCTVHGNRHDSSNGRSKIHREIKRFSWMRRLLGLRNFVKVITVALAMHKITFLNHFVDVVVEGCAADSYLLLCCLL